MFENRRFPEHQNPARDTSILTTTSASMSFDNVRLAVFHTHRTVVMHVLILFANNDAIQVS